MKTVEKLKGGEAGKRRDTVSTNEDAFLIHSRCICMVDSAKG
jgi:hypothetical protein